MNCEKFVKNGVWCKCRNCTLCMYIKNSWASDEEKCAGCTQSSTRNIWHNNNKMLLFTFFLFNSKCASTDAWFSYAKWTYLFWIKICFLVVLFEFDINWLTFVKFQIKASMIIVSSFLIELFCFPINLVSPIYCKCHQKIKKSYCIFKRCFAVRHC